MSEMCEQGRIAFEYILKVACRMSTSGELGLGSKTSHRRRSTDADGPCQMSASGVITFGSTTSL